MNVARWQATTTAAIRPSLLEVYEDHRGRAPYATHTSIIGSNKTNSARRALRVRAASKSRQLARGAWLLTSRKSRDCGTDYPWETQAGSSISGEVR